MGTSPPDVAALQAELAAARAELEDFFRVASHDLRAPLRHLKAFGGLLRERLEDLGSDDEALSFLANMEQSTALMGRMVDGLLGLSRIGRAPLTVLPLDLAALAAEVRDGLQAEAAGRNVAWHIAPDLPACQGDPALLRQLLQHLLGNALKFTRRQPAAQIAVGWQRGTQGAAEIFVRDNGAGFNPAAAGRLFGVFERLHGTSEFEGLGLGLAAVRRIAERHGGSVRAEGALDAGCTVYVRLAAAAQE
ncbi:ATP-binding protein [Xylophilus sp. GW821-FHT01B05]